MKRNFNSDSKEYKDLWNKYYSGGYDFKTADRLFRKELLRIKNKPQKDVSEKTLFWTIVTAILAIAGIVISILIAHHAI